VILLAAAWLHLAALRAPFFADDYLFLDLTLGRSPWQAWLAPDPIGNYMRPVGRQLWFGTLSTISGASPAVFHAANLVLLLLAIALFWLLARRVLGASAATMAASLLALQHAADVPVWWASGSQDLLALCLALAALLLYLAGRRALAAVPFLLALLSKEVIALTPLIAIWLDRRDNERWTAALRRAWPLFAALALWAAALAFVTLRRPLGGLAAHVGPAELMATPFHLLQTALGAEWSRSWTLRAPTLSVVALAGWVIWEGSRSESAPGATSVAGRGVWAGALWAILGAAPVVMVAGIWSAYYFVFATCGTAWAIAAALARRPAWSRALVVALLGWSCENARRLPEFATAAGTWATLSHVNLRYLQRGMEASQQYLGDLESARPSLPPRSTLFFSQVPSKLGFQAADGPLVRWAYRDTSLRSYYLTQFRLENALRGPVFFFQASHGDLHEVQGADSLQRIALGLLLSDAPAAARDVWRLDYAREPGQLSAYRLAWTELALARPDSARAWLARSGATPDPGPAPEVPAAYARVTAGDTTQAIAIAEAGVERHALDPGLHALLADLLLVHQSASDSAVIESYATWTLAPHDASSWRRWGVVSYLRGRFPQANTALERYFALAGAAGPSDREAQRVLAEARRRMPGGELAQEAVRERR
jgi:hypothetical protein